MNLSPVFRQRFFDSNGLPLSGGKLYSYSAGTTSPQATYTNATGTANTNPVILDSSGYADIWLDPTLAYKFLLKTSADVQIWSVDNVVDVAGAAALNWNANSVYSQGALVLDSSGKGLLYVSLIDNNQNNALTNVSAWRVFAGNIRRLSASTTLAVTDDLILSDSSTGDLIQTLPPIASTPIGKRITIKDVGTGGHVTSVKGAGADLIDENSITYTTNLAANDSLVAVNNGTGWYVLTPIVPNNSITTAKLRTANVTASKIADGAIDVATKIVDGVVTQAKLAARATGTTVAAGGVAVSASSGSFVVTSDIGSGYAAVTNLSVTITTTGRPVMLMLTPDSNTGSLSCFGVGVGASAALYVSFKRGSTAIGAPTQLTAGGSSGSFLQWNPTLSLVDVVAAGTYTYSVVAARGVSNGNVSAMCLVAFEL